MKKEMVLRGGEAVFVVTVVVSMSLGAYAQSSKTGVSNKGPGILMNQGASGLRPIQEALKESQNPATGEAAKKEVTNFDPSLATGEEIKKGASNIPDEKSTTEQWTGYFKTQLEAAGKITDPKSKMTRLAELTSDLVSGLMNGAKISVDSEKAVLTQVSSFISSDAFKKLADSTDNDTQMMVSSFLTIAQDTLNSAVKKYGDKLDQTTVTGLKTVLKTYESKIQQEDTKIKDMQTTNFPAVNAKAEEWTNYFKTQLQAAGKVTDSKEKLNQLAMVVGDLGHGLMNGSNISADSAKEVLAQVTSFINSDAFKKLAESTDKETQGLVCALLTSAQASLDGSVKKYGDKLDQTTVTGMKDALKKYEGKILNPGTYEETVTISTKMPAGNAKAEEWTNYFKTQLEAVGKITDPKAKMTRLAEITIDLVSGLMNGANISVDSAKTVLTQVSSFISSDAFKKLAESTDKDTQGMVSSFLTIAQDTLNSAVKKYGDKLDQTTVTGMKDALKKYEGKIQDPGAQAKDPKGTLNIPKVDAKTEEWTNYFKTQLQAAGKVTDSKEKLNQLAMVVGDLGHGLMNGSNISADSAKEVLAQVTSFINSDAFKKLAESTDKETQGLVCALLTSAQASLDGSVKKYGDKLDQTTVTGMKDALKKYEGKILNPGTYEETVTMPTNMPSVNAKAEEWTKYFKAQVEAVNKIADPQARFTAWNELISDLSTGLKNGANISADTLKEMVNQVSAYINSDAFKKLDVSNNDKLNRQVADFISMTMDTLKTAIDKSPDKLDKKTVTSALTALETFFGTKGFEMGEKFAALPKEQKERLMNEYAALGKKILETKSGTAIDADVKTQVAGDLSKLLTTQMRELFRNKNYKVDITAVKKEVVNALCNFVKSDEFKKMSESQQKSVIENARYVAVELIWRPENNTDNKKYVNQMAGLFKTAIESSANAQVKASAVNQVTDIFRVANWRNKEVAGSFMKEAFSAKGGVKGVIDDLLKAAGEQKDANLRGEIAVAISNLLYHEKDIAKNCGYKLDADTTAKLTKSVTDYMKGVNDGSIKASGGTRNSLLHIGGLVVSKSISEGTTKTDLNKAFNDAYIAMAKGSLLLKKEDGGSVSLQTTVINKLNGIKEAAEKKKETALADQAKAVLLDKNFDVAAYLKGAKDTVQSLVGIKADSGSWYVQGMTNIGKLQLQNNTGNLNGDQTKGILSSGKEWITGKYNLKDQRLMAWQSAMFRQMFNFAKEIYKTDAKVYTEEQKKEYEAYFKAIFGQIATLDDPLVKEQAIAAAKDLAAYLKQSGQESLITRLGISSYVS